jgi:hypothetical protein
MVLREFAVLVMALAFLATSSLVAREHLLARTGLAGSVSALCQGDPAAAPASDSSGKQGTIYLCNQCVACQATLATVTLPAIGAALAWHLERQVSTATGSLTPARTTLPYARGPPLLG